MNKHIMKQSDKNSNIFKLTSGHEIPLNNFNFNESIENKKLFSKPCNIHKTENILYCFDCYSPICTYCRLDHTEHCYSFKNNFLIKSQAQDLFFDKIDNIIKNSLELSCPKKLFEFFYDKLDYHLKMLQESLEKYRITRVKELHSIFEAMNNNANIFNKNYNDLKETYNKFFNDGKNFFPSNTFSEVVYLQLFNILNIAALNEKSIVDYINVSKKKTVIYEEELTNAFKEVESMFVENFSKTLSTNSLLVIDKSNLFEEFNTVLQDSLTLIEKFSNFVNKRKKKTYNFNNNNTTTEYSMSSSSLNNIDKYQFNNNCFKNLNNNVSSNNKNNKKITFNNLNNQTCNYILPQNANALSLHKKENSRNIISNLNCNVSNNIQDVKYANFSLKANNNQNNTLAYINSTVHKALKDDKKYLLDNITYLKMYESTFINYLKTKEIKFNKLDLKESTNVNKIIEASQKTYSNYTLIRQNKNVNTYLSPQNKINQTYSVSNQLLNLLIIYKDILKHKTKISKIKSECISFIYEANNNNLIEANPLGFLEEEGFEYFKAIPETNKIQLYDYYNKKPYIIEVFDLNSSEFGYNKFPFGCRCFCYNDNMFIIGGKDANTEYNVILLYEINTNKLIRCPDMKYSRCYHSVLFNSQDKILYIIGGEKNKTCEGLLVDKIKLFELPHMNYERANATLYLYKQSYVYAFCGYKSSIIEDKINDTFERINISYKDTKSLMNSHWDKVIINNKANIDLKFEYVGIVPLTDSHIYMYGGYDIRTNHKTIVVFDLIKHFLISIKDKEILNIKLSIIEDKKFIEAFEEIINK